MPAVSVVLLFAAMNYGQGTSDLINRLYAEGVKRMFVHAPRSWFDGSLLHGATEYGGPTPLVLGSTPAAV